MGWVQVSERSQKVKTCIGVFHFILNTSVETYELIEILLTISNYYIISIIDICFPLLSRKQFREVDLG